MQPLHYDLRCPAAKYKSIPHAGVAPSNLDAAITMRSAQTELQNTLQLRATASNIAAPKAAGSLDAKRKKKTILKHFLKGVFTGKSLAPKLRKSADGKTQGFVLRLSPQHMPHATFISNYHAFCNISCQNTMQLQRARRRKTHRNSHSMRTTPTPARTRRTHKVPFIAGCSHLKRKNTGFHAPAFPPTQAPCNIHAAITLRSATPASKTQCNCNAQEVTKHIETAITVRTPPTPARTRCTPFIAGCSHCWRKNTRFRAPAFPSTQAPCNIHAAITIGFATSASKTPCNCNAQDDTKHIETAITVGLCQHQPAPAAHTRYIGGTLDTPPPPDPPDYFLLIHYTSTYFSEINLGPSWIYFWYIHTNPC